MASKRTKKVKVSELTDEDIKKALKKYPLPKSEEDLSCTYSVKLQRKLNIPIRYGCWKKQLRGRYELVKKIIEFSDIDYKLYFISMMLNSVESDEEYENIYNWAKQFISYRMSLYDLLYAYEYGLCETKQLHNLLDTEKITYNGLCRLQTLLYSGEQATKLKSLIRVIILNIKNYNNLDAGYEVSQIMIAGVIHRAVTFAECLDAILIMKTGDPAAILYHIAYNRYHLNYKLYQRTKIIDTIKKIKVGKPEYWLTQLYINVSKNYIDIAELKEYIESRKTYYAMWSAYILHTETYDVDEEWCKSVFDSIMKAAVHEEPLAQKLK